MNMISIGVKSISRKGLFIHSQHLNFATKSTIVTKWIAKFNTSITENPRISLVTFLAVRNVCWYGMTGIFSLLYSFPADLAIGFLLAKSTAKFRQPANVALAGIISSQFPLLKTIKCAPLLGILPVTIDDAPKIKKNAPTVFDRFKTNFDYFIVGPVDKYGFSLFLASKINIVATVVVGSICIRSGMDTASILSSWGISESLQSGGGAMAMATVTNIFLLPYQLYFLPRITTFAARLYGSYENGQGPPIK